MKPLNELSGEQLGNIKTRLGSDVLALKAAIKRKQDRLDDRLERQEQDSAVLAVLSENLNKAQVVHTELINAGAVAGAIATAQELVEASQAAVDGHEMSPTYVSDEDAQVLQIEIDEMEQGRQVRLAKIAEIDALLAA